MLQERIDGKELFHVKRNENSGCETKVITSKRSKSGKGAEVMKKDQKELHTGDKKMSHILIPSLCHMVYWGQLPLNKYWNNNMLLENLEQGSCTTSSPQIPSKLNCSMKTKNLQHVIEEVLSFKKRLWEIETKDMFPSKEAKMLFLRRYKEVQRSVWMH